MRRQVPFSLFVTSVLAAGVLGAVVGSTVLPRLEVASSGREAAAVRQVSTATYRMPRSVIDPAALVSEGRALIHRGRDGRIDGYRLSGLQADGVLRAAGLRNGDVVRSANGRDLHGLNDVRAVWYTLDSAPTLQLEVERAGRRVRFHYTFD